MSRITNEQELTALVEKVAKALPSTTEEAVNAFLDARMKSYDKVTKVDSHLVTKAGKIYLPYPYNKQFVGKLHSLSEDSVDDEYDF